TGEGSADQAGAEGPRPAVRIGEDRIDVAGLLAARRQRPFTVGPGEIAPGDADVDLLDREVADVSDPELVRRGVEAHPERIAEAVGPDLPAVGPHADEWVVGRDRAVEVQAEDLAVERRQVLRVRVGRRAGSALIVAVPRVADSDVELSVGAHAEHA